MQRAGSARGSVPRSTSRSAGPTVGLTATSASSRRGSAWLEEISRSSTAASVLAFPLLLLRLRRRRTVPQVLALTRSMTQFAEQVANFTAKSGHQPLVASDGKTYNNECKLRQRSCDSDKKIRVAYTGEFQPNFGAGLKD